MGRRPKKTRVFNGQATMVWTFLVLHLLSLAIPGFSQYKDFESACYCTWLQYLDDHVANEDDKGDGKGDDESPVDHLGVHL